MIGYVTLGTNDLQRAASFYDAIAEAMGTKRMMESDTFIAEALRSAPFFGSRKYAAAMPAPTPVSILSALFIMILVLLFRLCSLTSRTARILSSAVLFIDRCPGPGLGFLFRYAFLPIAFSDMVGFSFLFCRVLARSVFPSWHDDPP